MGAAVETIVTALSNAKHPLIVTANPGRNSAVVPLLAELSSVLAIGVISCAPSSIALPASHPYHLGYFFGGKLPYLPDADVVLLLDVDVPWVDVNDNMPHEDARVFVIDNDPLKRTFGWSHIDADMLCAADAETALRQLIHAVYASDASSYDANIQARKQTLDTSRAAWQAQLTLSEALLAPDGIMPSVSFLLGALRDTVIARTSSAGQKVIWLNEAASASGLIWNHIGANVPGSMFMSGGTSLGWVLGASIGASIGAKVAEKDIELVVSLTGDGNYLFGAPESAFWVARRYNTVRTLPNLIVISTFQLTVCYMCQPFFMIVLNNRGWFVRIIFDAPQRVCL